MLNIRSKQETRWDLVSLGEILLRFDPNEYRISNAREFKVWGGGAEFNVVADAAAVFGLRGSIMTALVNNGLGQLAAGFAKEYGVNTAQIKWRDEDGSAKNGMYFIERGFGVRAPSSVFDRVNTAVSQLGGDSINFESAFSKDAARWFHTGGVFTGLSATTPSAAEAAMKAAFGNGAVVSYDLNYRHSLWKDRGGRDEANRVNAQLLNFADVVFGCFDFDSSLAGYSEDAFAKASAAMFSRFPNLKLVISTLRETHSANCHSFSAVVADKENIVRADTIEKVDVYDRVGSGDGFAAGFIAGLLNGNSLKFAADCGTALGALTLTTPGDVSMSTADEVYSLMRGESAVVKR